MFSDGLLAVVAVNDGNDSQVIVNSSTPPTFVSSGQFGAVYLYTRDNNNWNLQAYIKGSNINDRDGFGSSISISTDGNTLAVGASRIGSTYIFTRSNLNWEELTILNASNPDAGDSFGSDVSLSGDGLTLAIAAPGEDSQGTGIDNNAMEANIPSQTDNSALTSGAVYVFTRNTNLSPNTWTQQAYIKSSNTETNDSFGSALKLNNNGNTLAVSANGEDSNNRDNQFDNTSTNSGAIYIFAFNNGIWSQEDYIKANNIHLNADFGSAIDLNANGNILAIGSQNEKSGSIGYSGDQTNSGVDSGAAYLFERNNNNKWNQKTYLKASNTDAFDDFGFSISLSDDATTVAVGAPNEKSTTTGINGDQLNNDDFDIGAVYVY